MEKVRTRELYSSSNGDRWHLCRNTSGKVFVLHQATYQLAGESLLDKPFMARPMDYSLPQQFILLGCYSA
jgi:hypothetical protein